MSGVVAAFVLAGEAAAANTSTIKIAEPVVILFREFQVVLDDPKSGCDILKARLGAEPAGGVAFQEWEQGKKAWEPWSDRDLEPIRECDDFPCKVKFGKAETEALKALGEDARFGEFLRRVEARISRYRESGERLGYEFDARPVEPWKYLIERAHEVGGPASSSMEVPTGAPLLGSRIVRLSDSLRDVRQVYNRRVITSEHGARYWLRDVYNTHYFESWGEWGALQCDVDGGKAARLSHVLLLEVDEFKKGSLLAVLGRGKVRHAISEEGAKYQEAWLKRVIDAPGIKKEPDTR